MEEADHHRWNQLADQNLVHTQRRDHQLVECAKLALAGDRQCRDDQADQQRDAGDQVRHHEPLVGEVRVEPVARHCRDNVGAGTFAGRCLGGEGGTDLREIARDDLRGVGAPAVEHHLQITRRSRLDIAGKVRPISTAAMAVWLSIATRTSAWLEAISIFRKVGEPSMRSISSWPQWPLSRLRIITSTFRTSSVAA